MIKKYIIKLIRQEIKEGGHKNWRVDEQLEIIKKDCEKYKDTNPDFHAIFNLGCAQNHWERTKEEINVGR